MHIHVVLADANADAVEPLLTNVNSLRNHFLT